MTNPAVVLLQLLGAMLRVVLTSFVTATSRREAISSSAVFLVVFFVVHGLGNLTAFISGDAFNAYGHKLHSLGGGYAIYAIETYLAAAFVWHFSAGMLLTSGDKKLRLNSKFSWTQARLALSGMLFSVFIVLHVSTFRFGTWYTTIIDGVEVRDLWKLQREVFSSKSTVVFYVCSVAVIACHLLWGWQKTVRKPQGLGRLLPKEAHPMAETIGNVLTVGLTVGPVLTLTRWWPGPGPGPGRGLGRGLGLRRGCGRGRGCGSQV